MKKAKKKKNTKKDFDKFLDFLKKKKIPYERFSPDGICPSIAIHFFDDGSFWKRSP